MIKKIALGGIFILASAFSLSTATAVTGTQTTKQSSQSPKPVVPHGLCPGKC
ncbi:MAG: hypothetical protein QOI66_602 [Myxococcales bacterium]|jgi:hypothetical protein|nr:hypothetical protein [Myxococcales bacterium]